MHAERHQLRQKIVAQARAHGIKATVRAFACSRNTVRKWLRRYRPGTARNPQLSIHSPPSLAASVPLQRWRSRRAAASTNRFRRRAAQGRVPHPLRRWRHQAHRARSRTGASPQEEASHKRSLRAVKAQWRLFQQLCTDTKYLQDIPYYWPQMRRLGLPPFQYTVREVVSGLCFTGYADERSRAMRC